MRSGGVLFIIFLFSYCKISLSFRDSSQVCGTLYTNDSLLKTKFLVYNGERYPELYDKYFIFGIVWNINSSVEVTNGCVLTACSGRYFKGNCIRFTHGPTNSLSFNLVRSLNCTCPDQICKCGEEKFRKANCARAYLDDSCNACTSPYINLKTSEDEFANNTDTIERQERETKYEELKEIPLHYINKIESFVVRKGCFVNLYNDTTSKATTTLEGVNEWKKTTVKYYRCSCGTSVPQRNPKASENPLIDIPNTNEDMVKLLKLYEGHQGLLSALKSAGVRRSNKNAYILLFGFEALETPFVINMLFDQTILIPADTFKICTNSYYPSSTNISEFRIPVPVDDLGIQNSELRIIYSCGFGKEMHPFFINSYLREWELYLSSHEELSYIIPNVILIFPQFFEQMLPKFHGFLKRIMDSTFANIIYLLSDFGRNIEEIRTPNEQVEKHANIIQYYMPNPVNIVRAKTKPDSPMINGYYKLPNGELYPRNLFKKIESLTFYRDPIGYAIMKTAFSNPEILNATFSTHEAFKSDNYSANWINRMEWYVSPTMDVPTRIEWVLVDPGISIEYNATLPDAVKYLQEYFVNKNILSMDQIPRTRLDITKLFKEIQKDNATLYLLDKSLDLKPETFDIYSITGFGYNILEDRPVYISPFRLGQRVSCGNEVIYKVHNAVTCKIINKSKKFTRFYSNRTEYLQERLKSLNVTDNISDWAFKANLQPGYNILENCGIHENLAISGLFEYQMVELTLKDDWQLTDKFVYEVKNLQRYNQHDEDNVLAWESFFDEYGTHVVKSARSGGAIEVELTGDNSTFNPIEPSFLEIIQVPDKCAGKFNESLKKFNIKPQLHFYGGYRTFYINTDLKSINTLTAQKQLSDWIESLALNPDILNSSLILIPMSEIVEKMGEHYSTKIKEATRALFNGSLKYEPPKIRLSVFKDPTVLWGSLAGLLLIVLIVIVTGLYFFRVYKSYLNKTLKLLQHEIDEFHDGKPGVTAEDTNTNIQYLKFDEQYEIDLPNLKYDFQDILGSGHFGIVYEGTLQRNNDPNPIPVAVKMMKPGASANYLRDSMKELKVMMFIKSQNSYNINIVQVFGAYTKELINNQLFVVMEYCPKGNLLDYLRKNKAEFRNMVDKGVLSSKTWLDEFRYDSSKFSTLDLIKWSSEIANGMKYIADLNIIHGDLAARNVLLDENRIAKISDFGLSKQLQSLTEYIRNRTKNIPMPWAWLALECHTEKQFSLASDVWSFGVTLWEIFSLGEVPYQGLKNGPDFITLINNGFRMSLPAYSTYDLHNMMLRCWNKTPSDRPNFEQLYAELINIDAQEEEVEDSITSYKGSSSDCDGSSTSPQESTSDFSCVVMD